MIDSKISVEDLANSPLKELLEFQTKLNKAIELRKKSEQYEVYARITAIASESGFSLDELLSQKSLKKTPATIKYRNPNNQAEGWAGRGRKPKWVEQLLAEGKSLEDFAV
jgi:DNA-binding protein H-NS